MQAGNTKSLYKCISNQLRQELLAHMLFKLYFKNLVWKKQTIPFARSDITNSLKTTFS